MPSTAAQKLLATPLAHGMRIVALCHVATLTTYLQQHGALCPPLFTPVDSPLTFKLDLSRQGHTTLFTVAAAAAFYLLLRPYAALSRGASSLVHFGWLHVAAWLALYFIQRQAVLTCPNFVGNYGWHWQLAETSLLCAAAALPPRPSRANVWLFRWLAFRVMWGAGMSKLGERASACWRWPALSCTTTHYETQPLPSPLAFFLHLLPVPLHQAEVLVNHAAELVAPYLLWAPWPTLANTGAAVILTYMAAIAASGSYATIQLITIAPVVASWQTTKAAEVRPAEMGAVADDEGDENGKDKERTRASAPLPWWRIGLDAILLGLIAWRSIEPVRESLSPSPWLHTYDSFLAVNSYGVFGFVNARRYALGLSVSASCALENGTVVPLVRGRPLDLPCLPGDPTRAPCIHTFFPLGYHRMLDWDVWIRTTASLEGAVESGRIGGASGGQQQLHLVPPSLGQAISGLLAGDDSIARALFEKPSARSALLGDSNSYGLCGDVPVTVTVRSVLQRYEFSEDLSAPWVSGRWWRRWRVPGVHAEEFTGRLAPPALAKADAASAVVSWLQLRLTTVLLVLAAIAALSAHVMQRWLRLVFLLAVATSAGVCVVYTAPTLT